MSLSLLLNVNPACLTLGHIERGNCKEQKYVKLGKKNILKGEVARSRST